MYIGDFAGAREYLEQGLSLYDPVQGPSYAELAPADTFVSMSAFLFLTLTWSGYLEQARRRHDAAFSEARRLAHTFTQGYALYFAWQEGWAARSEPADLLQLADEIVALANQGGFAYWRALALAARGWCLSALGRTEEGVSLITIGLTDVRATGATMNTLDVLIRLADAYRMAGQPEPALRHLAEAGRFAETTQTKWVQAEALRLQGDLLILTGDHAAAEVSFRDAIALAQRQSAKLFELRASTSLARLSRDQGKRAEARDLLGPIYKWFTEGFDAPDLKDAEALLDELA
jgi:predicted ATPase